MRAFAQAWPDSVFGQQPVGQIPWGHNLVLLTKLKARAARLAYATSTLEHTPQAGQLASHLVQRRWVAIPAAATGPSAA